MLVHVESPGKWTPTHHEAFVLEYDIHGHKTKFKDVIKVEFLCVVASCVDVSYDPPH